MVGQAFLKGKGVSMGKHFENLDDFEDDSRSPAIDWVEWLLNGIFIGVGSSMMGYTIFLAISAYLKW